NESRGLDVADGRRELAGEDRFAEVTSWLEVLDVRRRLVLRDVLHVRAHPPDRVEVDAVARREDAARPNARRDGVAAIDADAGALERLRVARLARDHGLVVEAAREKDRQRSERLAVLARD